MKKIVLFDFDGVIANTLNWAHSVSHSLYGINMEQYLTLFEGNIYESVAQSLPIKNIQDHHDEFFAIYVSKMLDQPLVQGIAEILKQLSEMYTLHIISSSVTSPLKAYIAQHHIDRYFADAYGSDVNLSKVEKFKMAFAEYNIQPDECVFITDTLGDILEAKKAGVASIAVTWGFHELERLERGKPFKIITDPSQLTDAVNAYFKKLSI